MKGEYNKGSVFHLSRERVGPRGYRLTDNGGTMVQKQKSIIRLYESDASESTQRRALGSREIPVAVSGLRKMKLPLPAAFVGVTQNITGVDIDQAVDGTVSARERQIAKEPTAGTHASSTVSAGNSRVTTESSAVADNPQIHDVTASTLSGFKKKYTLSTLQEAIEKTDSGLSTGDMVVDGSTVPQTNCQDNVTPKLVNRSGLAPYTDFAVTAHEEFQTVGLDGISGLERLESRGLYQKSEPPHLTYTLGDGSQEDSSVEHGATTKQ